METESTQPVRELASSLGGRLPGPAAEELAQRLRRPDLADIRAVVSWRGAVVEPGVCHVSLALAYLDLLQRESCGRCTPCRIGTDIMRRSLRRLQTGSGSDADLELLRTFARQIDETALCGVANTIREPILASWTWAPSTSPPTPPAPPAT